MSLNESSLEERFLQVSTSAGSIQTLSKLCLHYKNHHKKIANIWLKSLQKADVKQRLTLIYLANDIVQNAKRKNAQSFIDDFKSILKDTIPFLRDEKIKKPVERVFSIWQDRAVFDAKFTNDLKNRLNNTSHHVTTNNNNNVSTTTTNSSTLNRHSANDILECLNRLANIEKSVNTIKSRGNNVVDRLNQGPLTDADFSDTKVVGDLKLYISSLKSEIDERNKLSRLLEESVTSQKKLLRESESQLSIYKTQLDKIVKLRDELG